MPEDEIHFLMHDGHGCIMRIVGFYILLCFVNSMLESPRVITRVNITEDALSLSLT